MIAFVVMSALTIALAIASPRPPEGRPITFDEPPSHIDASTRLAFRAAFGGGDRVALDRQGRRYLFEPVLTVDLVNDRIALVSVGTMPDASHAEQGLNAISYLERNGAEWRVVGTWFGLGAHGTFGQPGGEWRVTRTLGPWPVLLSRGGGTWQGCTSGWNSLSELRPAAPIDIADFHMSYSDANSGWAETRGEIEGALTVAEFGRSFTIRYTGDESFEETYERGAQGYRLRGGGESRMAIC